MYFKVTYNPPKFKNYIIIESVIFADSKHHAIELALKRNSMEYPDRKLYKAKLLK